MSEDQEKIELFEPEEAGRKFIKRFRDSFITLLDLNVKQAQVGSIADPGKEIDVSKAASAIGSSLVSVPIAGRILDSIVSLFAGKYARRSATNKAIAFNKIDGPKLNAILFETGAEIFKHFEYVITHAVDGTTLSHDRGLTKLAVDAADRILNHVGKKNSEARKKFMTVKISADFLTKGLIKGRSSFTLNSSGIKPGYNIKIIETRGESTLVVRKRCTTKIFSKSGLIKDAGGKFKLLKRKRLFKHPKSDYEYRLKFPWESEDKYRYELNTSSKDSEESVIFEDYKKHHSMFADDPKKFDEYRKEIFAECSVEIHDLKDTTLKEVEKRLVEVVNGELGKRINKDFRGTESIMPRYVYLMNCSDKIGDTLKEMMPEIEGELKSLISSEESYLNDEAIDVLFDKLLKENKTGDSYLSIIAKNTIIEYMQDEKRQHASEIVMLNLEKFYEEKEDTLSGNLERLDKHIKDLERDRREAESAGNKAEEIARNLKKAKRDLEMRKSVLEYIRRDKEEKRERFEEVSHEVDSSEHRKEYEKKLEEARKHMHGK